MANVLFLRAASQDLPDRYETTFSARGYHPFSVPVLQTVLTNTDDLSQTILRGPHDSGYHGVIITSSRACDAWAKAVKQTLETQASVQTADWSLVPFYVVGTATAKALAAIRETLDSPCAPKDIRGGSESGSSERLAHFILGDMSKDKPNPKLLYLTGDKNRDTIFDILGDGGVEVVPLKVYETAGSSTFAQDLRDALASAPRSGTRFWWIVFFAPSAADFVLHHLRELFDLQQTETASSLEIASGLLQTRVACIGPTTSNHLRDNLHLRVDVVSPKPTADDLLSSILERDTLAP